MSRTKSVLKFQRELSLAAGEEQRRLGHAEIDVEHLFLALLSLGGPATRALGEVGVSLERARNAVARLKGQGGQASWPDANATSTPVAAARRLEWSKPALRLMRREPAEPLDLGVLAAIIGTPGGTMGRILCHLALPTAKVRQAIDDYMFQHDSGRGGVHPLWDQVHRDGYVPAAPRRVWELVSHPARRVDWDWQSYAAVRERDDGVLVTTASNVGPTGKPRRSRPEFVHAEHSVTRWEPLRRIEWEITYPHADKPLIHRLAVQLGPRGEGTRILLTEKRLRSPDAARGVACLLHRFAVERRLRATVAAISRALG